MLDGNALYADRSGKGDLTGPGKSLKNAIPGNAKGARYHTGPIIAADGKTRYPEVRVWVFETGRANKKVMIDVAVPLGVGASRAYLQRVGEESELQLADRPGDAPILHFDGPLFVRGDKPSALRIVVGTPGLGRGTFAVVIFDSNAPSAVAQIAFPHRKADGNRLSSKCR
jgi:hypothetical protein